jgi:putative flippase GtrA
MKAHKIVPFIKYTLVATVGLICDTALVLVFNYVMNRLWTFKKIHIKGKTV